MTEQDPPNLVLIGFMATGKSTIGRMCAQALRFGFRDSDMLVSRRAGKAVADIFAEDGEPAFRAMEASAVRDLARARRVVIATGGGVVLNSANVAHLRRSGIVILLSVDPATIVERAGGRGTRPLLAGARDPHDRVSQLLREREPYYRAAAHTVVETGGLTRDEAADRVLAAYRGLAAAATPWVRASHPSEPRKTGA